LQQRERTPRNFGRVALTIRVEFPPLNQVTYNAIGVIRRFAAIPPDFL